ncbi:hypothetical protein JTB14_024032 [Gonioctena quinquepunctata]|nr:hypothetical protein JTB14_024032 [Gonioctena quinquepunctata]
MSLLPYCYDDPWDDALWKRNWDMPPIPFPSSLVQFPNYFSNSNSALQDTCLSVKYDNDKFHVNFDVQHFQPEEISVKVVDRIVLVEGNHEEKQDEHGHIYRHFVRKYVLPENCDVGRLESKLSPDGILTVSGPRTLEKIEHGKEISGKLAFRNRKSKL